jgi:hypothetical protein
MKICKNVLIKLFLCSVIFLLPGTAFSKGNKYGMFVGIGKYSNGLSVLRSSVNDATAMCQAFSAECDNGNSTLLLDENATRENILRTFQIYTKKAVRGDLFVFYYSGHGTRFPDRLSLEADEKPDQKSGSDNEKGNSDQTEKFDSALIPIDSARNTDKRNWGNLILDDELYRIFAQFTQKEVRVVFISDSCYSGGQAKSLDFANKKSKELGPAKFSDWKDAVGIKDESELKVSILEQKEFQPDSSLNNLYILIASSGKDEPSYSKNPKTGFKMSAFTHFFLETLNFCKSEKQDFTYSILEKYAFPKVSKFIENHGKEQLPVIDTSFYKVSLEVPIF